MSLLKLLDGTVALTNNQTGDPASYQFQTREAAAFFRQVQKAIDLAYSSAGAPATVGATGSPMTITSAARQSVHLVGGTVSALALVRNAVSLPLAYAAGGTLIPMAPGDSLVLTYTVAPTIRTLAQ